MGGEGREQAEVGAERVEVRARRLPHGRDLPFPEPASPGSAGVDLRAAVDHPVEIPPGEWRPIPTGLAVEIPHGWEGQVRPRSGLARRHGLTLLNSPGTVDSDYRGEIQVLLLNLGPRAFTVHRGERIAQLVVGPVGRVSWQESEELAPSRRGEGGFGSTGSS